LIEPQPIVSILKSQTGIGSSFSWRLNFTTGQSVIRYY
jgi:hypothetical protein